MFARSFFILSVVSSAFALYTNYYPRGYDAALGARADSPADQDLLNSCPGGPGSSAVEHADKCTLVRCGLRVYPRPVLTLAYV